MTMSKLLTVAAVLAVALSMAGYMVYSTTELRAVVRLNNPELEHVALAYFKEEVRRQEEVRKMPSDAQGNPVIRLEFPTPKPNVDAVPKTK
jgi:hypothetical protein